MADQVCRAVRASWLDRGLLTDKAFRRRPGKDLDGLSISNSYEGAKRSQRSGAGVATLDVDAIEELGLTVSCPGEHGVIAGLPFDTPENYAVTIEFAERLCKNAEFNYDPWNR